MKMREKLDTLDDLFPPDVSAEIRKQFSTVEKQARQRGLAAKENKKMSKKKTWAQRVKSNQSDAVTLSKCVDIMDSDVVAGRKLFEAIRSAEAEQRRLDDQYGGLTFKQKMSDAEIRAHLDELRNKIDGIKALPKVDLGWNGAPSETYMADLLASMEPKLRALVEELIAKYGLDKKHDYRVTDADLSKGGLTEPRVPVGDRQSTQKQFGGDPIGNFITALAPGAQPVKLSKKERKAQQQNPLGTILTGTRFVGRP